MASEKVSRKSSEEGHLKKSDAAAREEIFQTRSRAANRPLRNKKSPPQNKILDPTAQRSLVTSLGAVVMAWGDREYGNEELNTMRTFNSSEY